MLPLSAFDESSPLSGEHKYVPNQEPIPSTIDEPIRDTIMRDINSIKKKFKNILFPTSDAETVAGLSRDWDLWGPLILCLVLSVVLAIQAANDEQRGYVFALVFIVVWAGSAVVTLNAVLLKANVSFFQTVCVLGYCVLPLVIAAIGSILVNKLISNGFVEMIMRSGIVGAGIAWASKASVGFMTDLLPQDKKLLGIYPVWLLYVAIGWIVLIS